MFFSSFRDLSFQHRLNRENKGMRPIYLFFSSFTLLQLSFRPLVQPAFLVFLLMSFLSIVNLISVNAHELQVDMQCV